MHYVKVVVGGTCMMFILSILSNRESSHCKVTNLKLNTNSAQLHFVDLTVTKDRVCLSNYISYNTIIFIMHARLPESDL